MSNFTGFDGFNALPIQRGSVTGQVMAANAAYRLLTGWFAKPCFLLSFAGFCATSAGFRSAKTYVQLRDDLGEPCYTIGKALLLFRHLQFSSDEPPAKPFLVVELVLGARELGAQVGFGIIPPDSDATSL